MRQLLKYFLVGAGVLTAVIAFVAICAGIIMGIGYVIDKHPLFGKIVVDMLIVVVVFCFLTAYGRLICD